MHNALDIEDTRQMSDRYGCYWKISFTLTSYNIDLKQAFFAKWAESPIGDFPFSITSDKGKIKITFSDKKCTYKQRWNQAKQKHESIKPALNQQYIDDYKKWFYELYGRMTEQKIER